MDAIVRLLTIVAVLTDDLGVGSSFRLREHMDSTGVEHRLNALGVALSGQLMRPKSPGLLDDLGEGHDGGMWIAPKYSTVLLSIPRRCSVMQRGEISDNWLSLGRALDAT